MSGKVYPLHGAQQQAVDPRDSVWLSASAGTGKTQVLSARVLRLLLQRDVHPSQLLCLTFTKAGAAEMAVRVNEVLANWVRMPDAALMADLEAIGAAKDAETLARARSLFASVLDCPGGGLRIDTIHAFSQYLLATFPEEAGLNPGAKAMEDRERDLLAHEVLAELLLGAQRANDTETLDAIAAMSLAKGPDAVQSWLMRCAAAMPLWQGPGAWQPPFRDRVNRLLGLSADAGPEDVHALCADDSFDTRSLRRCLQTFLEWDTKTGREGAEVIEGWLACSPEDRAGTIGVFYGSLLTKAGEPPKNLMKRDPEYAEYAARVLLSIQKVRDMQALLALTAFLTPALAMGRKFALLWDEAKQREGFVDFDDQIRLAAALLSRPGLSEWIRFKLDRRFDHVLIDEAQDTNEHQWAIIFALIDEYFSGEGARDGKMRTVFTVGDYKQAIFRFQGTSPENFEAARQRVKRRMAHAAADAAGLKLHHDVRELQSYGLGQSFRTAEPVLEFVDKAIDQIGWERFGLKDKSEPHVGQERPGLVALWPPVSDAPGEEEEDEGGGEDNWLSRPDRQLADRIARQVKHWITNGFPLVKGSVPRNAGPGDVMVLVRKRKELAGLIVARLHAAGVPVAGVDRLRLGGPLAVKDLMAALRFAAQPLDDLNLANLLASPLVGWSQEQLLEHVYRGGDGPHLWEHLRRSSHPDILAVRAQLGDLLALADFESPQAMLHWILAGPWRGRRRLVERLGGEANDPIDELLNAAHAYASAHIASLQGFIQWFDTGEGELKREAGASDGLVRVMTVHGSKGLQAPIVILADAADNPDNSMAGALELEEEPVGGGDARVVPLPGLTKDQKVGPIAAAELATKKAEREEHWRLLYVAMTRAEEALFVGGSLGPRDRGEAAPDSWYAQLAALFEEEPLEDPIWGWRKEWGTLPPSVPVIAEKAGETVAVECVPEWVTKPAGPEPRPPRPLAPSAAGEDLAPDPPTALGANTDAVLRGVLMHKLLERLPQVPLGERESQAMAWLRRQAADISDDQRSEMVSAVLGILSETDWAELFGAGSLAEVPIAARVGGQVIAGTVDRLLVTAERVLVVDYKTARRPPQRIEDIPADTLRQMAAYQAALEAIYPGRAVEPAVLYTQTPQLFALPEASLAPHKAALQGQQ